MTLNLSAMDFFLRQMPNPFHTRHLRTDRPFVDLKFSAIKETELDTLFPECVALHGGECSEADAECSDIVELSCNTFTRTTCNETQWHGNESARRSIDYVSAMLTSIKCEALTVPQGSSDSKSRRRPKFLAPSIVSVDETGIVF